ncbi:M20/M25/M40 family metallo-hydrolase [Aestuariibacter salexigens]|uniref:M20/M25/M40 family metallo-hydrolase n=1 Tax=Aestuariibacter salexigens TaxID=226010 RepID=UPI00041C70F0|nr:M20/M25/M40 family metallo-hydrolase [Aestuariibacter salexigens]
MSDLYALADDMMQGRRTGTRGAAMARQYVAARFTEIGLQPVARDDYFHPFDYPKVGSDISGVNVLGVVPGDGFSGRFIVVTAHYDHLGKQGGRVFNGADDNASGVAAMLALAASIKQQPLPYSVLFLATDAEEKGLYGAKAFVESPPVSLDQIVANLNLDMLGQGKHRYKLYISGAGSHPAFEQLIDDTEALGTLCIIKGHRDVRRGYVNRRNNYRQASDHGAFLRHDIPYLFVGVAEHGTYHTDEDSAESIPPAFYQAATEASLILLRKMANITFTPRQVREDVP